MHVCECANKLNATFIASSGPKSVQQKPNCSCSATRRQQRKKNKKCACILCCLQAMQLVAAWGRQLSRLAHLVAATWGTYTIKVHNIKFHSVSGFERYSRRRRRQRCVAIETAEAILHFVAHFMGSHCVAIAKAIVVVVVVAGKAYLPFSWPLVWAHFLTHTHTDTPAHTPTHPHRHGWENFCSAQICSDRKAKNFAQFT